MSTSANRHILVVDDTSSIHDDFRRILSGTGIPSEVDLAEQALFGDVNVPPAVRFDIDSAYQGHDGLEMVRSAMAAGSPYALAFVDMRMPPGWDGVETIQQIWRLDPRLQIVICTAHSDYSWDELLGKLGVEDRLLVLKKPFENVEVTQLASALTTKWEMTRRAELKVSRLEEAVKERTSALEIANKELEDLVHEVTQLYLHDTLTGLPNRLLFADRVTQALDVAARDGSHPAVMMLDLDRFKEVNDTLGHHHGDLLLKQVSERLTGVLRQGDTVARFGGDEFALLLKDGGAEVAIEVAIRIAEAFGTPFCLSDATVGIEASIGIAICADAHDRPTLEELLRQADIAMYKAKADRSGYALYAACTDDGTPDRLTLLGHLRQALDCEEFVVYYQPKVAVGTGALLGVEALIRWQHPTRGLLLPEEFIPLAEKSTLIHPLTRLVLDSVLHRCANWLEQGLRLPVSVNVSARSLRTPDFATIIGDRLAETGVPADMLTIELTEGTMLAHPGVGLEILHELREVGVNLSVDDYGTGYSSLSYLKNLPVTELKIDRSFIKCLSNDPTDFLIVQSATSLGHSLGLSIVAEGVEDQATLIALQAIGIDVAQGLHLGRPMSEDLLMDWIENRDAETDELGGLAVAAAERRSTGSAEPRSW